MKDMITDRRLPGVLSLICVFLPISLHVILSKNGVSKLHRLCHSDVNTLCQDVVGNTQVVVEYPSTPFEDLNSLSHGGAGQEEEHYYYPAALDYGVPKDMCMWQAFLNNEIKSEECAAALKIGIENVQKQLPFFYYSNLVYVVLLHILALAHCLTLSHCFYLIASEKGLSPRFRTAVVFGPLLVSFLYIVSTTLRAGGAGHTTVSVALNILVGLTVALVVMQTTMMMLFTPSEQDEEEKQQRCDSEDGYRRMVDNETALYVAVPLQVV